MNDVVLTWESFPSSSGSGTDTNSRTVNVPAGTEIAIFFGFHRAQSGAGNQLSIQTLTLDGQSYTRIGDVIFLTPTSPFRERMEVWYLLNPPVGNGLSRVATLNLNPNDPFHVADIWGTHINLDDPFTINLESIVGSSNTEISGSVLGVVRGKIISALGLHNSISGLASDASVDDKFLRQNAHPYFGIGEAVAVGGSQGFEWDWTTSRDAVLVMLALNTKLPVITTESPLPNGTVGVPYSQTIVASGGAEPFSLALTDGALPDSLSLDPGTGNISGTPSVPGPFTFKVKGTDDDGLETLEKEFTITILDAPPPPSDGSPRAAGIRRRRRFRHPGGG